jgi:hypothetical protein
MANWEHSDRSLAQHAATGIDLLASQQWTGAPSDVDNWLGSLALRHVLIAGLIGELTFEHTPESGGTIVHSSYDFDNPKSTGERLWAAKLLYAPLRSYTNAALEGTSNITVANDTGVLPLLIIGGVVKIVAIAAAAGFAAYCAYQAAQIINAHMVRKEDTARVQAADASALKVVEQHLDQERQQGQFLPLSSAEIAVLKQLQTEVETLLKKQEPGIDSGLGKGSPVAATTWTPYIIAGVAVVGLVGVTAAMIRSRPRKAA